MSKLLQTILLAAAVSLSGAAPALANDAAAQQRAWLASADPQLAANKRLVYDFWREVFEGLHMELADKYLTDGYIQHNPNVPSGRAGFVNVFSRRGAPKDIQPLITGPLVTITAERDLVTLVFTREYDDPTAPGKKYTTTWFDMFRIENGKIAEHWDPALKR